MSREKKAVKWRLEHYRQSGYFVVGVCPKNNDNPTEFEVANVTRRKDALEIVRLHNMGLELLEALKAMYLTTHFPKSEAAKLAYAAIVKAEGRSA